MQTITSGPSYERIVRTTILMFLACGFSIAFFWDGLIAYPRENITKLRSSLGLPDDPSLTCDKKLTKSRAHELIEEHPTGSRYERLTESLGPPSFEQNNDAYYLGWGGQIAVRKLAGFIEEILWVDGPHTKTDLDVQMWFGVALGLFGAFTLFRFVRTVTYRTHLSEAGLKLQRRETIPLSAMRRLQEIRGDVRDLVYDIGEGERSVRLDPYDIRLANDIIELIKERIDRK